MTELEIKQKANDLAESVRNAYITGALDNAKGDSETFAEHYGCLSDTTQEELLPIVNTMEKKYQKVNASALEGAMMPLNGICGKVGIDQYKSIVYFEPHVFDFSIPNLVGISVRLTGRWDGVKVTNPDARDHTYQYLRLLASVEDLLPEFIVEGESWTDEDPDEE